MMNFFTLLYTVTSGGIAAALAFSEMGDKDSAEDTMKRILDAEEIIMADWKKSIDEIVIKEEEEAETEE